MITVESAGQNRIAYVPGATLTVTPEAAVDAFARTRPAVVLMTLELPLAALDALTDAARAAGATVVLNATPEAIGAAPLLARIEWLVVNESEAGDLLGHGVAEASGADAARALAKLGPRVVVVTLGAAGAVIFADGETTRIAAPQVDVVDTTGAGDAACGAIAAPLAAGSDPIEAARAGVVAGTLACTAYAASMPTRAAIDQVLACG